MPIDQSKLVLFPAAIQQSIIDPNTGIAAAGGWVEFTKTDQTTPKAVYKHTGDPGNPYEVANDLTPGNKGRLDLNNAGALTEFPLFFYPYDETDNKTSELYYYRVNRSDGSKILDADNMPDKYLNEGGSSPESDEAIENLYPSYGFESIVWEDVYASTNYLKNEVDFPATGWVWYKSNPENGEFYYTVEDVTSEDLTGNPANELVLHVDNKTGAQTRHWLAAPVSYARDLIGQSCEVIFYNKDSSTVAVTELDVVVIFTQEGVYSAPIQVGTATLSTSQTQRITQFTFPALPAGTTYNWDKALVGVNLPLNQDLQIGFTGTFFYPGNDKTITIPLGNFGKRIAQARNSFPETFNNEVDQWKHTNLPVINGKGRMDVQNRTGTVFTAGLTTKANLNYAHQADGTGFVQGEIIDDVTLADRLLTNASPLMRLSPNCFVTSNVTATEFDVELALKGKMLDGWTTNITGLTITKVGIPSANGIGASVDGVDNTKVNIVFNTDFTTATTVQNYKPTSRKGEQVNLFTTSSMPVGDCLVNWFGVVQGITPIPTNAPLANFVPLASSKLEVTQTQAGSPGTPAEAYVKFGNVTATEITPLVKEYDYATGSYATEYSDIPTNFIAYLKSAESTMPQPAPYVISFKVDGKGDQIPAGVNHITVPLESADLGSPSTMATKLAAAIGTGDQYNLDYSAASVPPTGEWIKISTAHTQMILIYWKSDETKPSNPDPDRLPVYIEYEDGATLEAVIKQTANIMESAIGGFPTLDSLVGAGMPEIKDPLHYYVEL